MNSLQHVCISAMLLLLVSAVPAQAQEASILNPSGMNVPRFVSLKSDFVNVRVGPGKRYPIRWVYKRKALPVEIVEEFAHWRKIRDMNGDGGWLHKSLLSGTRTVMILDKPHHLYSKPNATSQPVLRAGENVIGTLKECTPDWCDITIGDYEGWIRKADIWGITREEVFEE